MDPAHAGVAKGNGASASRNAHPRLARLLCALALTGLQATFAAAGARAQAAGLPARGPADAAQVLVLTGTDPYLPAFVAIDSAMRSAVAQRLPRSVVWMHESIDTARFGGEPGPMLAELLARKYEGVRIDAVVLVTEPAVEFYLHHRQRLWPDAPPVFHSVAPAFAEQLPPGTAIFGIPAAIDFAGTLRIAVDLQPAARRLLVVSGVSLFDQTQLAGLREALVPWATRLSIEYLTGLSPRAVAERLAGETPDTIVLYTSLFRDADRQVYAPREVLETISAASRAPVYGFFDSYMGHGLAAGAIESFEARGDRVADLLVRVLDGTLSGGAVIEPPPASECVADGRQLERFGLSGAALPAGCEVRYVEPSFLRRYGWQSLLVALALVGQALLITSLLLQRRRRRAAELSLQAQRVQLLHASRLAVAGELTASIAHEINQPLGAILSNADAAELLLEAGRMDRDELLQILADIRRDDLRASAVIQRLRTLLARHETERRRFSLNQLVEETLALLRAESARRGVALDRRLNARTDEVVGDPVQIQQVLINLVLNAFDASAAVADDARRVLVETADTPDGVELRVRDFGSGIAAADLPKVFDSFFSTKRSGMGLGLSIARSIVEAHGGTIAAASHEAGAVLRVLLPTAPDRAERSATHAP